MKKRFVLKITVIIIPVLLIGMILYLLFCFQKKNERIKTLKNIPVFSLKTIDNTLFESKGLTGPYSKVIIYFNPDCDYCRKEAKELSKIHYKYTEVQWIWIASEPITEIKEFACQYNLDQYQNIQWCQDEQARLYQTFGMNSIPYFLVYDHNNRLIKRWSGVIKLEKLLSETLHEKK